MSRRCKPGQRARIISGSDSGKIVVVVKAYFYPERVSNAMWHSEIYPWVVTSLSGPIRWLSSDGKKKGADMTVVMCDLDLEPLKDDDDGLTRATDVDKPSNIAAKKIKKPGQCKAAGIAVTHQG